MGEPAALSAVLSGYDTTVSCYHSLLFFARLLFEGLVRVAIEQIKFYMLAVHPIVGLPAMRFYYVKVLFELSDLLL